MLALIVMRTVTVGGPHTRGASLKGSAAALLLGFAAPHDSLPLLAAAAAATLLPALIVAERAILAR